MSKHSVLRGRIAAAIVLTLTTSMLVASTSIASAATGVRAVQVGTGDTGNGKIDRIAITFSVPMDQRTPSISTGPGSPGFRVDGYQIAGFTWSSATVLHIGLSEGTALDSGATPTVTYEAGGGGATSALGELEAFSQAALDRAGPVLVEAFADDQGNALLFNARFGPSVKGDSLTLVFSEPATLAGVGALARWTNLEKAIRFNNDGSGCTDGQGTSTSFNFPQPSAGGSDPIIEPADANTATTTFKIKYAADAVPSTQFKFPGVPVGCWLGIESDQVLNAGYIEDEAGNAAIRQVSPPVLRTYVEPVDASIVYAQTKDRDRDGSLDAVELAFDQLVDDDTVAANLSRLSVRLGSFSAPIGALDTGATANDNVIVLPLLIPAGTWDTGVRPEVSYAKPAGCTATGGTGIKAIPRGGPSHRTCVASFDFVAWDGAKPLVLAAGTTDANGNGKLDRVTVTFTEVISAGTAAGWKLNGNNATGFTIQAGGRTAEIPIAEGSAGDTGSSATLSYTPQSAQPTCSTSVCTRDAWNNEVPATSMIASDGAAPRIQSAKVRDANGDGALDRLVLTYSEAIVDPTNAQAGAFEVGGLPATGVTSVDGDEPNDATLALVINVPGTGKKDVSYSGLAIKDAAGNISGSQLFAASAVTDEAAPKATIGVSPSAPLGVGTSTVTVTYSETMNTAIAPTVTLGSKTVTPLTSAHTNGFRTDDTTIWEGTVDVAAGDCSNATGCAVTVSATQAKDPAGNLQAAGSLATEIDTIAPASATLGSFSTTQSGGTVPALTINRQTRRVTVDVNVDAGDAAGGLAEIIVDGNPLTGSQTPPIGASATRVSPSVTYADLAALSAALPEGTLAFGVRVCDDAGNCADTPTAHDVLIDLTGVAVTLTNPTDDRVVAGGEVVAITWDGDETALDFSHVDLELSTNGGSSYGTTIASGLTEADGSYDWTTPQSDTNAARVRAVAVDDAGNRTLGTASQSFAIDSSAPSVTLTGVGDGRFLPERGQVPITWSVSDATVDRVADPITIEQSTDGGKTWAPINGGSYSKANDGTESLRLPTGVQFNLRVRVTAVDATDAVGTATSTRLVSGVEGYIAGSNGRVVAFGAANDDIRSVRTAKGHWNAGLVMAPNGRTGYTFSDTGRLYGFSIGGAKEGRGYNLRLARGTAVDAILLDKDTGYVLDGRGRLHGFGGAPKAKPSKTWSGDRAAALVLTPNRKGAYVLDSYGKVFPVRIGSNKWPATIKGRHLFSSAQAVDVVLNADGRSGYILRNTGKVYPFGGARKVGSTGISSKAGATALVGFTDNAGYWIDGKGRLRRFGAAFGDPTLKGLGRYGTRGAAAV